jgi:hypothetical protein
VLAAHGVGHVGGGRLGQRGHLETRARARSGGAGCGLWALSVCVGMRVRGWSRGAVPACGAMLRCTAVRWECDARLRMRGCACGCAHADDGPAPSPVPQRRRSAAQPSSSTS